MSKVKLLLDVIEDMRSLVDSIQAVADAMLQNEPSVEMPASDATLPTEKPEPAVESAEKPISLEAVRAVLADKSHDGKTEAVRELLLKFGAAKLSGIDPRHYTALLHDAEVL